MAGSFAHATYRAYSRAQHNNTKPRIQELSATPVSSPWDPKRDRSRSKRRDRRDTPRDATLLSMPKPSKTVTVATAASISAVHTLSGLAAAPTLSASLDEATPFGVGCILPEQRQDSEVHHIEALIHAAETVGNRAKLFVSPEGAITVGSRLEQASLVGDHGPCLCQVQGMGRPRSRQPRLDRSVRVSSTFRWPVSNAIYQKGQTAKRGGAHWPSRGDRPLH